MNKRLISTLLLSLACSTAASAADLPSRVAAPFAPVASAFTWTGFYVGAHGGYGSGETKSGVSWDVEGAFGGLQAGYNYQHGAAVFGIEADIALTDLNGSVSSVATASSATLSSTARLTLTSEVEWLGTVRPRIGYAFDQTLVYATGGLAFADFSLGADLAVTTTVLSGGSSTTSRAATSVSDTVYGWTVGGGIEHAFMPNVSAKLEYSYVKLDRDEDFDSVASGAFFEGHLGKIGVNYKF